MTNKDEIPYIIRRTRKQMTEYKNPHYVLFFAKLKQYAEEKRLSKNFSDSDFRFLMRDDATIQESYRSNCIKSFLSFCSREDVGICQQKFIKQNGGKYERFSITDLSKYETFQDYLRENKINYVQIRGEPDRRTLEEKLGQKETIDEAGKEPADKTFFDAIKKRFGNT